jgi:D-alanine-D-alanine ligase
MSGKKRIALIQGGMGAERNVSLATGGAFEAALKELGYPYEIIDAQEDLPVRLANAKADVALIALHGKYAEDGIVQSICEYLRLPYSGSGVLSSALCMDKVLSKQMYVQCGIPTAPFETVDLHVTKVTDVRTRLGFPLVVKPSREGSSVGITIVNEEKEFLAAIQLAAQYDHYLLIEKFIAGMEASVPVLKGRALSPIEIVPKSGFYDYKNKYTKGSTDYYMPPRMPADRIELLKSISEKVFETFRLKAYSRIDFRVDENHNPFVMEVNTLPGCTPTSLLPKAAAHEGISFSQVIQTLIECASLDYKGLK